MKVFVSILFIFLIFSCYKPTEILHVRAFYIMGSEFQYKLYCKNKSICEKAVRESQERLNQIDFIFSNYREDSVLTKVNLNASIAPVTVPAEFVNLTEQSIYYSEFTSGSFDITIGKLYGLWKKSASTNQVPENSQIEAALKCTGYKKILLDKEKNTVSFNSNCLELDFGAIGKGYAVDEVVKIVKSHGIKKGLINFGGNIYALDKPDEEKGWEVGINDPFNKSSVIDFIYINNLGVATSGDYEKFFVINGKRYSHIINPQSGFPVENLSSVTVLADSATKADALSTAFSVMGKNKTEEFVTKSNDVGVMIIDGDRSNYKVFKSELFKSIQELD